ncbi:uncharacterized protein LOC135399535 [Ornithodoros turicata]|uniref:uncharacterized protein LOC135399535 n=1 Tax=Ornithodoros turicata TaxID=34597 RepID=UPI00313861B1
MHQDVSRGVTSASTTGTLVGSSTSANTRERSLSSNKRSRHGPERKAKNRLIISLTLITAVAVACVIPWAAVRFWEYEPETTLADFTAMVIEAESGTTLPPPPPYLEGFYCPSATCAEQLVRLSLSSEHDPCDDFYAFVCSNFTAEPGSVPRRHRDEIARFIMRTALETKVPELNQTAFQKAAKLFQLCSDSINHKVENAAIIKRFLEEQGIILSAAPSFDLIDAVVKLSFRYNLHIFFELRKALDSGEIVHEDGAFHFVNIFELVLPPTMISWMRLRKTLKNERRYDALVNVALSALGIRDSSVAADIKRMVDDSKSLRDVYELPFLDSSFLYTGKVSFENANYPWVDDQRKALEWMTALTKYSNNSTLNTRGVRVPLLPPNFLSDLFSNDEEVLRVFYALEAAIRLALLSSQTDVRLENTEWSCYNTTMKLMPFALVSPLLLPAAIDTKNDVQFLEKRVKEMLNAALQDISNKSVPVLDLPLKVAETSTRYGFPLGLEFEDGLEAYYEAYPDVAGTFLEAFLNVSSAYIHQLIGRGTALNLNISNLEFSPTSLAVRYTIDLMYLLDIPAALMLPPFFATDGAPETNYAFLGTSLATALLLADSYFGSPPWSQVAVNDVIYASRSSCPNLSSRRPIVIENNRTLPQQIYGFFPLSMKLTRAFENLYKRLLLADILGIYASYKAYESVVSTYNGSSPEEARMKKDDQLFFISTCYRWCRSEGALDYAAEGDLSARLRCNEPLKDIPQFARAFRCARNSPMNPSNKCGVV